MSRALPACIRRAATVAASACLVVSGLMIGTHWPAPVETFELVATSAESGDSYVLDYDLTISDCVGAWDDYPAELALSCERSFN